MSFLREAELSEAFEPFIFFRNNLGLVPNLFRAQSLLPRVLEVEAELTNLLLVRKVALTAKQKQLILLLMAAARRNTYCVTLHWEALRAMGFSEERLGKVVTDHHEADLSQTEVALLDFCLKLSEHAIWICGSDIDALRRKGLTDEQILEAQLVASYEKFACTLATGLGARPDFEPKMIPQTGPADHFRFDNGPMTQAGEARPYLRKIDLEPENFQPFAVFQEKMGFIPSFFRAQTLRTDLIESQARALQAVLLTRDVLPRLNKEFIFLVISAANLNTYCVANHCGLLRGMGIPEDQSDQIAFNHREAGLPANEVTLLDFALKLTQRPAEFSEDDIEVLRGHGFSEEQILEAVVLSGFVDFINMLNVGLGVLPDFKPRHIFKPEHLHARSDLKTLGEISSIEMNLSGVEPSLIDEDTSLVARVRDGDMDAFEDLVRRHHGRIYRTLVGITGNADEAQDYTQNVFLKAFKSIGKFEGAAKFSTWLTRIAINEGIERMRSSRRIESLDDEATIDSEDYRPRQVQAWVDDPEQLYSRKEMREIVEKEVMKLPAKYRVAVILRDVEQLSNQEAAASMSLGLEAFKSRLLRGRLALREALAPQFKAAKGGVARV